MKQYIEKPSTVRKLHGAKVVYDHRGLWRCFGHKELRKLKKNQLIDIVRDCSRASAQDMEILNSWERHFRAKKVPYAVVQRRDKLIIVKKLETDDAESCWK